MSTLPQRIFELVNQEQGLTDREITSRILNPSHAQQPINIAARAMAAKGLLVRAKRADGLIGNSLPSSSPQPVIIQERPKQNDGQHDDLSEDKLKHHLNEWLHTNGWHTDIAWGRKRGIDINAVRNSERWIIEVKGIGSLPAMRVNYFVSILGETLQRMDDKAARYSIALPDVPQFRKLWERLPSLAKQRTQISVLFISSDGRIEEVS